MAQRKDAVSFGTTYSYSHSKLAFPGSVVVSRSLRH